jgi:hypothetical protein
MSASVERIPRGPGRELLLAAGALVAGLVLLPLLVWVAGAVVLGPYRGGPWRLWLDYLALLGSGSLAAWILLLGPYALLLGFRLLRRLAGLSGG